MRKFFIIAAATLLLAGCSSPENDADTHTPDELADLCKDGFRYTVAGEDYCVFEGPAGDTQYVPPCPEGFTAHRYFLAEQEPPQASGEVFVCAQQPDLPDRVTTVLNDLLNYQSPSHVNTCSVSDRKVAGLCGACDCATCDEDQKTCTHMQCNLSKCDANQLCENQQCVPNPEAEGLTCENVIERWNAFSARHTACETAADCIVLNIPSGCDQSMAFRHGGDVLNHEGARLASPYFEMYQSDACQSVREHNKTYDVGPAGKTLCTNQRCTYEEQYCNLP